MQISDYISGWTHTLLAGRDKSPWEIIPIIPDLVLDTIRTLDAEYVIEEDIAIHRSATVELHVTLKGPFIIGPGCFIGAHAYLRGGVFLERDVVIGPGCEVKSSIILHGSSLAHFNFAGDCLIGSDVNMEAGSVVANHFNERADKSIRVLDEGQMFETGLTKFGALIGDNCKIGANAVLSPGTILRPGATVKRLQLIEQIPYPG